MKRHVPHRQVSCKVTAYVDEGIKDLVAVLNQFEGITTFESCQGSKGKLAFVQADYGGENRHFSEAEFIEMATFVYRLVGLFYKRTKGQYDGAALADISIQWGGDKQSPFIEIDMPPSCIADTAKVLTRVLGESTADIESRPLANSQQRQSEGHSCA